MRIVVHGVGGVGGTILAALCDAGLDAVGIARGAMLEAIRAQGLTLRAPERTVHARPHCVADPSDLTFGPDDIVLLTMKSQDTWPALLALRDAGLREQPVFCLQNGVANERAATRLFPNVHGATVMMPATYLVPGEVAVTAGPRFGMFDIGRFPGGTDADDDRLAQAFEAANIAAFVMPDVMASKYGKLLMNLGNIVQAVLGPGVDAGDLTKRVRAEAKDVYRAAGIAWKNVGMDDPRRDVMRPAPVPGVSRQGGSTTQSLLRGTGSVETDWLNGEIAFLARMHGVAAPLNARLTDLGAEVLRKGVRPGGMTRADLEAWLAG